MNENLDKVLNSSTFALFFMVLDLRLVKIGCRETINFFLPILIIDILLWHSSIYTGI